MELNDYLTNIENTLNKEYLMIDNLIEEKNKNIDTNIDIEIIKYMYWEK